MSRTRKTLIAFAAALAVVAATVTAAILIRGDDRAAQAQPRQPTAQTTAEPQASRSTASQTPTPTPIEPPSAAIDVSCAQGQTWSLRSGDPATAVFDLAEVWAAEPLHCTVRRNVDTVPLTVAETAALAVIEPYLGVGIDKLWEWCSENAPGYVENGIYIGSLTGNERLAAPGLLLLCPNHPQADAMAAQADIIEQDAAARDEEAELEAEGLLIRGGTWLVGSEVQPGTYVTEWQGDEAGGGFEACYWQRSDADGGVISNDFLTRVRRVEVTIAASDYSFTTEGCGSWRPL